MEILPALCAVNKLTHRRSKKDEIRTLGFIGIKV
jgi:hypothetical protein